MLPRMIHHRARRRFGTGLLVAFFWFGTAMCALTLFLLVFPGTPVDAVWRVKPSARGELAHFGGLAVPVMALVGAACAAAAIGLAQGAGWGRRIAIVVLSVNVAGDLANAVLRSDWRTLIGLPIGGLMILYLVRSR